MTSPYTVQKFQSPLDDKIVALRVNKSDNSILWRHILKSFGDVHKIQVDNVDIHFMMNEKFEDLLPLRIEAATNLTMKVILSKESSEKNNRSVAESPPRYDGEPSNNEIIRSAVLPFEGYSENQKDGFIRYGSRVSFRHVVIGGFLRAIDRKTKVAPVHNVVKGTRTHDPGLEDFWQIVPVSPEIITCNEKTGETITYGNHVRLYNVTHKRFLSCRRTTVANGTLSTTGEVVTLAYIGTSTTDDSWIVEQLENGTDYWKAGESFILRHESTNLYLNSNANTSLGENEITGIATYNNFSNLWKAEFA